MRLESATFAPEQLTGREKVESVSPSAQQANSGAEGLTALALLKATPPPTRGCTWPVKRMLCGLRDTALHPLRPGSGWSAGRPVEDFVRHLYLASALANFRKLVTISNSALIP